MPVRSSFFTALRSCIQQSLSVGLAVSVLLTVIVLTLGSFAQAAMPGHRQASDTQTIEGPGIMKSGGLLCKSESEYQIAPLLHTDVHISISGMIARVKVKQSFHNPTREWKTGVYVFPLPETAAVGHMRMLIGERIIEGQIKEKVLAKKTV
jgi:Ca-activated chloride channel family protein